MSRYEDILHLPHYRSTKHAPMSAQDRAAQFAPFAALSGYGDAIEETGRLTADKPETDEDEKQVLDLRLRMLAQNPGSDISVTAVCFRPDEKKSGGSFRTISGRVKKVDEFERLLVFENGEKLPFDDLIRLESRLFSTLED